MSSEPDHELERTIRLHRRRWTRGVLAGCLGVPALLMLALIVLLSGYLEELRELTNVAPYSSMIGRTYRIIGDLEAKGVTKRDLDGLAIYILLFPRSAHMTGREFSFTRPLSRGQTFRILSAWIYDTPLDDSAYYVIDLKEPSLPPELPIQLRFDGDLGSTDGELNPEYFERVQ